MLLRSSPGSAFRLSGLRGGCVQLNAGNHAAVGFDTQLQMPFKAQNTFFDSRQRVRAVLKGLPHEIEAAPLVPCPKIRRESPKGNDDTVAVSTLELSDPRGSQTDCSQEGTAQENRQEGRNGWPSPSNFRCADGKNKALHHPRVFALNILLSLGLAPERHGIAIYHTLVLHDHAQNYYLGARSYSRKIRWRIGKDPYIARDNFRNNRDIVRQPLRLLFHSEYTTQDAEVANFVRFLRL